MIILKTILIIATAILLFCGLTVMYAFCLMKQYSPETLYNLRREQSDFTSIDQIPSRYLALLVRQEDAHFYSHHGYDPESLRFAWRYNWNARRIVYGGSGITQQLAKNLYFRRFKHGWLRKLPELVIALNMERTLGKNRILELYVNIIYFGNGMYGISDATRFYFGKPVSELTLNQMVILSLIPPIPTAGNPIQHPEVFKSFRDKKLCRFAVEPRLITPEEAADIRSRGADDLDPDLRKPDDHTRNYPTAIPYSNERFGPLSRAHKTLL